MTHDEEHRAIVRSGIDSALRLYIAAEDADFRARSGEDERVPTPRTFLSTNGGTMAIGGGCFLVRPRKPQSPRDKASTPSKTPRDDVKTTMEGAGTAPLVEGVVPAEAITLEAGDKPAEIASAAGSADDGAGPLLKPAPSLAASAEGESGECDRLEEGGIVAGADISDSDDDPDPPADEGENTIGVDEKEAPALHEAEGARVLNHEGGAEVAGETRAADKSSGTTAEAGAAADNRQSSPTDNPGGPITQAGGEDRELETAEARNPTGRRNSGVSEAPSINAVLDALLRDMTSAAEAWSSSSATRLAAAGHDQETAPKENNLGCTAIVFLDAPLITADLDPRRRSIAGNKIQPTFEASRRESWDPAGEAQSKLAVSQPAIVRSDGSAGADASSQGSDTSAGTTPAPATEEEDMAESHDTDSSSGASGDEVISTVEEHAAGLGDPQEALEGFLSWIDEGSTSGYGRREILLVCCGRNLQDDNRGRGQAERVYKGSGEASATVDEETASDSRESGEENGAHGRGNRVIKRLLDARRDERAREGRTEGKNNENVIRERDVDAIVQGTKGGEPADVQRLKDYSSSGDKGQGNRVRGVIRQIVLGGTIPIGLSSVPGSAASTQQQNHDDDEDLLNKEDAPAAAERKNDNVDGAGKSPPTGTQPSTMADTAPPFARLPPSEVLLQTRPVSPYEEGLSRVTVTFPPHAAAAAIAAAASVPATAAPPSGTENTPPSTAAPEAPVARPHDGSTAWSDSVKVVVGPVVGRVGPTSAVVVVEVDAATAGGAARGQACTVAHVLDRVGVCLTDSLTGHAREMTGGTSAAGIPGGGPRIFEFEALSPGRRYTLKLIGVRRRDQVSRRLQAWSSKTYQTRSELWTGEEELINWPYLSLEEGCTILLSMPFHEQQVQKLVEASSAGALLVLAMSANVNIEGVLSEEARLRAYRNSPFGYGRKTQLLRIPYPEPDF